MRHAHADARSGQDRPDAVQSRHRRRRQGPHGVRDRRARRADGAGHRPNRYPVPHAQRVEGSRRAGQPRPGRQASIQNRNAPRARSAKSPHHRQGRGGRTDRRKRRDPRSAHRPGQRIPGGRGGHHHRHLPARSHSYRHEQSPRWSRQRKAVEPALRIVSGLRVRGGASQDRHAAQASARHHRLLKMRRAVRRP